MYKMIIKVKYFVIICFLKNYWLKVYVCLKLCFTNLCNLMFMMINEIIEG